MLALSTPRKPAPVLALRGAMAARFVGPSAFGNALGDSIAESMKPQTQGVGPYSSVDYRNGSDIDSDNFTTAPETTAAGTSGSGLRVRSGPSGLQLSDDAVFDWSSGVDNGIRQAGARLPAGGPTGDGGLDIGSARDRWYQTGEKPVYDFEGDPFEVRGDVTAAASNSGGGVRGPGRPVPLARSEKGDAAAQLIADPWGLLGPGMTGEYADVAPALARAEARKEIEEIRSRLGGSGRNVPDVGKAWLDGGRMVDDYSAGQLGRFRTFENLEALRRQGIVELDASWNIKSVASNREMFINPREVRFTQEWVDYKSSDKINTLDTTGRDVKVAPEKLPPMEVVVMPDGRLTSLDNRRLTAAYLYDAERVRVMIHAGTDPLPDTRSIERFSWGGYEPATWGEAAAVRIYKQGTEFREAFRQGSSVVPQVRRAPNEPLYGPYLTTPQRRR